MKKEVLIKKLKQSINKIYDSIDDITTLLEVESDDDELTEMSITFRESLEDTITDNDECNINDIYNYIEENL
jgi:hypothetical protein